MRDRRPQFQFRLHRSGHGGANAHSQGRNLGRMFIGREMWVDLDCGKGEGEKWLLKLIHN